MSESSDEKRKRIRKEQYERAKAFKKASLEKLKASDTYQARVKEYKDKQKALRRRLSEQKKRQASDQKDDSPALSKEEVVFEKPELLEGGGEPSDLKTPKPILKICT